MFSSVNTELDAYVVGSLTLTYARFNKASEWTILCEVNVGVIRILIQINETLVSNPNKLYTLKLVMKFQLNSYFTIVDNEFKSR